MTYSLGNVISRDVISPHSWGILLRLPWRYCHLRC